MWFSALGVHSFSGFYFERHVLGSMDRQLSTQRPDDQQSLAEHGVGGHSTAVDGSPRATWHKSASRCIETRLCRDERADETIGQSEKRLIHIRRLRRCQELSAAGSSVSHRSLLRNHRYVT
jgi:hypothetical protein